MLYLCKGKVMLEKLCCNSKQLPINSKNEKEIKE